MADRGTHVNDTNLSRTDASVDELERYADPGRPPAHGVYPLARLLIGAAIVVPWILPGPLGLTVLVLAAGAGVGFDVWLSRRFGLPRLWQLPPEVRQGQLVLIAGIPVVVLAPFILAWALPWSSLEVGGGRRGYRCGGGARRRRADHRPPGPCEGS